MKSIIKLLACAALLIPAWELFSQDEKIEVNPMTVELTRAIGRDIFEYNGVPFMQPVVMVTNATSNSRFFNSAKIDKDKFYIKFGIHNMFGLVPDDFRNYSPYLPNDSLTDSELYKYVKPDFNNMNIDIQDTAGLIHYLFKTLLFDGIKDGSITIPETAPTLLGYDSVKISFPEGTFDTLVKNHFLYPFLSDELKEEVLRVVNSIPTFFSLPPGANIKSIYAPVPQIEFGGIYGSEMIIRYIPPINIDKNVGDFSFWGIALKHSMSQYFRDPWMDVAVQVAYQGTTLENTVGITNSKFESFASIYDLNVHASKMIEGWFEVYSGFSYEFIDIETEFLYYISVETQQQLGLLEPGKDYPTPGYPGDQDPQTSYMILTDSNYKWVLGIKRDIGNLAFFIDYSISKYNLLSGGIEYRFDLYDLK